MKHNNNNNLTMPKEIYFNNCKYIVGKNANENWNILGDAEYGDIWIHLHNKPSCYVILQSKYVISEEHITYGCLLCKQNSKYKTDKLLVSVIDVEYVKKGKCVGEAILLQPPRTILI